MQQDNDLVSSDDIWRAYLEKSRDKPANPITTAAAELNQSGVMRAVDVGCGAGQDAAELLALGYEVIAYDASPAAVQQCKQRFTDNDNVEIRHDRFESFEYPSTGLITAYSSLFFCLPAHFDRAWQNLSTSIQKGGVFVGHFLGPDDDWASNYRLPTCPLTSDKVRSLFVDFDVNSFKEQNALGPTRLGATKHWHTYSVLAVKTG